MATSKKFSELPAASSVGNGDLFAIAHEDALAETGYVSQKLTAAQAGQKVNGDTEYPTSLPSFPENGQNPFAALEKLNADIDSLYPVNTASGAIANFTTSLEMPLTALSSTIVAQQAGTGTPSPSNPRSISGVSSVSFYQRGVNLWDEEMENGQINTNTGNNENTTSNRARTVNYIPIKADATYYCFANANVFLFFYDKNKNYIGYHGNTQLKNSIFTPKELSNSKTGGDTFDNACYMRIRYDDQAYVLGDLSINYPSTDTSYHAYNAYSDTFTIALGQTVYGGSVDAKSGKCLKTDGLYTFTGSETWGYHSSGFFYFTSSITDGKNANSIIASNGIKLRIVVSGGSTIVRCYISDNSDYIDTSTDMNTIMTNGIQFLYELATPVEIDITTNNFTTIAGEQNIFSDCGEVTVGFKQGIQEYIDAKIAETQALIL